MIIVMLRSISCAPRTPPPVCSEVAPRTRLPICCAGRAPRSPLPVCAGVASGTSSASRVADSASRGTSSASRVADSAARSVPCTLVSRSAADCSVGRDAPPTESADRLLRSISVICTSTLSEKSAATAKTARTQRAAGSPDAAKTAWKAAETAGPTTTPSCEAAETRLSPTAVWLRGRRSVTPAWATGTLAAKTPARALPAMTPYTWRERAMRTDEAAAPARQTRSTNEVPTLDEKRTMIGAKLICEKEKHETAKPTMSGCAPSRVR
jgi:hypothetical protein